MKDCDGCDLVKYCSDECQNNHELEHEEDCKQRASELRDELLFKQPECTNRGDCPICSLPLPFDNTKNYLTWCCSKLICNGCSHANQKRERELRLQHSCPFCRESVPKTDEESEKLRMRRIEANDPVAMCHKGIDLYSIGEDSNAFEYFTKAAELGDVEAHYRLSIFYDELQDVEKDIHHLEEAAIGGHPLARHYLGGEEWNNGNVERAVKHWIIAATQGQDDSIKALMKAFKEGHVSKEVLATALRANYAAVDATKSPQREAAENYK